jgi:hypothetical protein
MVAGVARVCGAEQNDCERQNWGQKDDYQEGHCNHGIGVKGLLLLQQGHDCNK